MEPPDGPRRPARWRTWSASAKAEAAEQGEVVLHLVRWVVLGTLSGVLAGVSSWAFLEALDWVTTYRIEHDWLIYLLPAAGLVIGCAYHYLGGRSIEGNSLIIDEIHSPTAWVPRRMAPLVLLGTLATHLFGGSAGREGTALQMSGSLTDWLSRVLRLGPTDRRLMLVTALAGGFGAVFGVPVAGAVFALEVQAIGRLRYEALVPAVTASVVGATVVEWLGYEHAPKPQLVAGLDGWLFLRVALAGVAFGLAGAVFAELTHLVRRLMAATIPWPPLRLVVGGTAMVGLLVVFGFEYAGLSLGLAEVALAGVPLGFQVFALKLALTAVTLGSGFPGGEVTPLFVIGATLGSALATPLGLPVPLLAGVGFVAVFAGAANTPLACAVMGLELFGAGAAVPIAIGCVVAYICSSHHGIYASQRIHVAKGSRLIGGDPTLRDHRRRRRPD